MSVVELFSRRKAAREVAGKTDVYTYTVPRRLRIQIMHIWDTSLGRFESGDRFGYRDDSQQSVNQLWKRVHNTLAREFGYPALGDWGDPWKNTAEFFAEKAEDSQALDIIELTFRLVGVYERSLESYQLERVGITQDPDDAIVELNYRFAENGVGYEFVNGEIIEKNNEFVHAESVKAALALLHEQRFVGASEEFMSAHVHLRNSEHKEAVGCALKALESVLKAICSRRKWNHSSKSSAKELIDTVIQHGLVPDFLAGHLGALRATLESGLPTVRNRLAGHGQGESPIYVPKYLAAYAIHLAAVNIVMLAQADKVMK